MAAVHREPGDGKVEEALDAGAVVSAVNLAEVVRKYSRGGAPLSGIREILSGLRLEVVPFDIEQAYRAGAWEPQFDALGLSLGDRACLSLAHMLKLPVMTADRQWAKLRIGLDIVLIR